ncbi:hypothetical protein [Leptospira selangorensis]|nr:hypothetical protein [Leptospira selangorensis]
MSDSKENSSAKIERYRKALEEIQDLAASDNHGDNADEIHQLSVDALESD